uniref:Uncharacterized protein n=1 Tax=Myoviridae sp. ct35n35 TaxID=2823534 RepID=A0A8S5LCH7_9CAUD|nr:MAG TPA: hypothetical protein [Myoviridae sp. ct35n35]
MSRSTVFLFISKLFFKFAFQGRCDLLRVKFVAVPNRLGKIPYICVLI